MSLNLTPVSTPHDKPIPPSRSKRRSILNSTSGSGSQSSLVSSPSPSPGPGQRTPTSNRLLLERNEDDLARASRDEILDCLRAQWDERDNLLTRITDMEEREERCMSEKTELGRALQAAQERIGTIYNEQSRLETDVEERDELLDRVRSRMGMIERDLREAHNRASNQEKAFEAERAAFQTQEAHLNARIRQLQSSSSTKLSRSPSNSEGLQEDLESLRISHVTLLAQLDSLSREVHDTRNENVKLQEENEGWEFLIRERTFQGHLFHQHQHQEINKDPEEGGQGKGHLEALDGELELEMDDLNTELDAHSPISDEETLSRGSTLRGQAKRRPQGPQPISRQTSISESLDPGHDMATGLGMDLATELGRAGEMPTGTTSRQVSRSGPPAATGEEGELEKENKRLREELKAVQLYCSKILDRIIAQDGFEHILSVDYKTRRMGRSASGRGSLQEVVQMMHTEPSPVQATTSTPKAVARPISTFVRLSSDVAYTPKAKVDVPVDNKSEKRARRGWSLDLRAFGFGAGGGLTSSSAASATPTPTTVPIADTNAALRPLALRPSPATATSSKLPVGPGGPGGPGVPGGRKLEPQAEDEEDRRERHRLEAALKLMGISKPSDPDPSPPPPPSSVPVRPERQNARRPNSSPNAVRTSTSTPLSRLSSALGFTDPPPPQPELPSDPDPSLEKVESVLREYDQRESIRRVSLSKGKAEGGYTSPPRLSSMRRHTDNEMQKHEKSGKSGSGGQKGRESISTLWSLGDTDSPPR